MPITKKQTVPINKCQHQVDALDGASEIIDVVSPEGRPVDVPRLSRSGSNIIVHAVEVTLAFAAGFLTAMVAIAG